MCTIIINYPYSSSTSLSNQPIALPLLLGKITSSERKTSSKEVSLDSKSLNDKAGRKIFVMDKGPKEEKEQKVFRKSLINFDINEDEYQKQINEQESIFTKLIQNQINDEYHEIIQFLESANLSKFSDAFISKGYTSVESLFGNFDLIKLY